MSVRTYKERSVLYLRVSSKDQEKGYSLPAQKKLLQEYSKRYDLSVAKVYSISESASGKQIRKTFNEMLRYVQKNNINNILCEKVDRLTRNPKDATSISDWINADERRKVHFVKENFVLDKNTRAHENLVWDMKVAIARFYTNNLSEEVRKGQKEKLAQGWLPATPPLGYKTIGEEGQKIHIIDEEKAPYMRKAFELYATGNYSVSKLTDILYNEGLRSRNAKKVSKSRLDAYLKNPFYKGYNEWKGEVTKGKQEPLISADVFDRVQQILHRTIKNPQYKKHSPTFKAMVHCGECGGTITWEIQKGTWYGHCNRYKPCGQKKYMWQDDEETQLFPLFENVAPKNERVLRWLEKALKEQHKETMSYSNNKRSTLNVEYDKLQNRLEAIYEDKIDGVITKEEYDRRFTKYTKEQEGILQELKKLDERKTAYYEVGYAVHELATKARQIYQSEKANAEQRKLLLSYAFSNMTLYNEQITTEYSLAFEFLKEWMPKLNTTFELEQTLGNKERTADLETVRSNLLGRWGSNPRPID